MCTICHANPCPSPCPNADTAPIGVCAYCDELIYDYEPRLREQGGRLYHTECLEALSLPELLEVFDIEAEVEE